MPVLIEVFSDRMKRGRGLQAQGPRGAGMTQEERQEEGTRAMGETRRGRTWSLV